VNVRSNACDAPKRLAWTAGTAKPSGWCDCAGLLCWQGCAAYNARSFRPEQFMASETEFVADLLAGLPADPRLEVPAGDDAAVLRPPAGRRTVVTVDMLMEGVDFVLWGE
jgi:hypothetical protein